MGRRFNRAGKRIGRKEIIQQISLNTQFRHSSMLLYSNKIVTIQFTREIR